MSWRSIRCMKQALRFGFILGLHVVLPNRNPVEETGKRRKCKTRQRHRLDDALPEAEASADLRLVRQSRIDRWLVRVVQDIHDMGAAHARRVIEPGILETAGLQILDALSSPI